MASYAHFYSGQTYIIYPSYAPSGSRTNVPTPAQHHMPHYEDLTLETPDNLKIKAYLILQGATASNVGKPKLNTEATSRPTILFLHANAGNMVRESGQPARMAAHGVRDYFFHLLERIRC